MHCILQIIILIINKYVNIYIYKEINWFSQETRKEVYFHLSLCLLLTSCNVELADNIDGI